MARAIEKKIPQETAATRYMACLRRRNFRGAFKYLGYINPEIADKLEQLTVVRNIMESRTEKTLLRAVSLAKELGINVTVDPLTQRRIN